MALIEESIIFSKKCISEIPYHLNSIDIFNKEESKNVDVLLYESTWVIKMLMTLMTVISYNKPSNDSTDHGLGSRIKCVSEELSHLTNIIIRETETLKSFFKKENENLGKFKNFSIEILSHGIHHTLLSVERITRIEKKNVFEYIFLTKI